MNTLSYAISFWSGGKMKANFLRHEGYLGAVGAFLKDPPNYAKLSAFKENFSSIDMMGENQLYAVGTLEHYPTEFSIFPLLADPKGYNPDTSNLTDPELKTYWINLLDLNLKHLVEIATEKIEDETRAAKFESTYRRHLSDLRQKPNSYGVLTVRGLLKLREQCLREMGFNDLFHEIKAKENQESLNRLDELLSKIDQLKGKELVTNLLENVIAGNMYDWGSSVIQELLQKGEMNFSQAKVILY